jgi:DnaJ-class molecular chaperone
VVVDVPDDLDDEQEALLRTLADVRGEPVADRDQSLLSKIKSAFT